MNDQNRFDAEIMSQLEMCQCDDEYCAQVNAKINHLLLKENESCYSVQPDQPNTNVCHDNERTVAPSVKS